MRSIAAIGLLFLLLCHILAQVLVVWLIGWQEEGDLSHQLRVYRSVDSLVEFYIPVHQSVHDNAIETQPIDGFVYRDNYYEVIRQEVKHDTLLILGFAQKKGTFWQQNLLDFIRRQFGENENSLPKKAHQLLKTLLKEYYQGVRFTIDFCHVNWLENTLLSTLQSFLLSLSLPIHSPPPEA